MSNPFICDSTKASAKAAKYEKVGTALWNIISKNKATVERTAGGTKQELSRASTSVQVLSDSVRPMLSREVSEVLQDITELRNQGALDRLDFVRYDEHLSKIKSLTLSLENELNYLSIELEVMSERY